MKKRKRKPRKRIGISSILCAGLLLAALVPGAARAKKKPALDTYAIVSGTVFDEGGYALPDVDVTLTSGAQPKSKPMDAVSSARGEFTFRVPPGPAHYQVTAQSKGYQSQTKSVAVQDQERVEVTFQLARQSK
jgi:Carboxypeptidase regulatory-like domain